MLQLNIANDCHLRLLEEADADELCRLVDANRGQLSRWMPWAAGQTLAGTLEFIRLTRRRLGANDGLTTAIVCDSSIAGVIGIDGIDWGNRAASIGYWLDEHHQGRGIMTRATRAFVDHAILTWKLHRVVIEAAPGNRRSRAIPERLGFRQEGVMREAERIGDRYLDSVIYAMLASDWRSANGGAEHPGKIRPAED